MKPFKPFELPIKNLDLVRLINHVAEANKKLAMYNGMLQVMINPHVLLAPLTSKEAVLSSKIEGTQVSFTELLQFEAENKYNDEINKNDIDEVLNYKRAMLEAEVMFKERPFIHLNMIKDLHNILLSNVRGNNKSRGEFRKIQVYIGSVGCGIENASYIPPEAQNVLPALDNWEKYINNGEQETLIACAIMHAQFEMIHPFLDGNGRMGRMLIPLFLHQKDCIDKPVFYMSEYFEKNRQEYYAKLNAISGKGEWDSWIEFFLKGIVDQSSINIEKSKKIIDLYNEMKESFINITHSSFVINVLDNFFKKPIILANELAHNSGIVSAATSSRIFKKLLNNGIISIFKETKGNRANIYSFDRLIKIIDN
ncbi:MAG: Fic family protein [Rickettsiales bacterium]|nr:Fic family protein [Rickettsiales bacterium]